MDAKTRTIDWLIDEETKTQRKKQWDAVEHPLKVKRGVLLRYARDVQVSRLGFLLMSCLVRRVVIFCSLRAWVRIVIDRVMRIDNNVLPIPIVLCPMKAVYAVQQQALVVLVTNNDVNKIQQHERSCMKMKWNK